MATKTAVSELRRLGLDCVDPFRKIFAPLRSGQSEITNFGLMQDAWDHYYFGMFSKFDCLLRRCIEDGGRECPKFLPLSISHHNLHRLIEVLRLEIGRGSLDSTRIEERIVDLLEVTDRLEKLLKETTQDPTYKRNLLHKVKR